MGIVISLLIIGSVLVGLKVMLIVIVWFSLMMGEGCSLVSVLYSVMISV